MSINLKDLQKPWICVQKERVGNQTRQILNSILLIPKLENNNTNIFSQILAKKPNLALSSAIPNKMLRGAGAKILQTQVNRDQETEVILKILTTHPQPLEQNSIK